MSTLVGYRAETVFDGDRRLRDGALVLVRDGSIIGVEHGRAPAPPDCDVVELPGTTLLPGLIDTHVHLCGDGGPRALDQLPELDPEELAAVIDSALTTQVLAGVTAIRDLGDIGWAVVDRRDTAPGRPWIVASGPPLTPPGGHCSNMGGEVAGADAIVDAVRQCAERGAAVVKVMTSGGLKTTGTDINTCNFADAEVRMMVDEAHRHGLPIVAHAHALAAVQQSVDAGFDGVEHCTCFTGAGIHLPETLAAQLVATGLRVCPTIGWNPDLELGPDVLAVAQRYGLTPDAVRAHAAAMHHTGVRIVSGSDAGVGPAKPHGGLRDAVIELAEAGVPVEEALASATGVAADACGLAERTGRLRAGLAADLVAVGGDAMRDPTALRDVRMVVARGHVVLPVSPAS